MAARTAASSSLSGIGPGFWSWAKSGETAIRSSMVERCNLLMDVLRNINHRDTARDTNPKELTTDCTDCTDQRQAASISVLSVPSVLSVVRSSESVRPAKILVVSSTENTERSQNSRCGAVRQLGWGPCFRICILLCVLCDS